jgi:2-methylcitrate dehydratase PrpD
MPFGAAVAILFGNAGLDQYTMQNIHSRELLDLMVRVDCYKDESLDGMYPAKWPAEVIIETTDGERFTSRIEYPKGDPENPLSWKDIQDKFLNMVSTVHSVNQANNFIGCVENLEKIENVSNVLKDLKREQ